MLAGMSDPAVPLARARPSPVLKNAACYRLPMGGGGVVIVEFRLSKDR